MHSVFRGEAARVADHIAQLAEDKSRLAHKALKIAFSQVAAKRSADLTFVFLNGTVQFFEMLKSKIHGEGCSAAKKSALPV